MAAENKSAAVGSKKTLVTVVQTVPPYRSHALQRIAREIPELRLLTINTHEDLSRMWKIEGSGEIGLIDLSKGHKSIVRGRVPSPFAAIRRFRRDWINGFQTIKIIEKERAAVAIVNGYSDIGRLRVMRWCRKNQVVCFLWGDSNIASEYNLPWWKRLLKQRLIGWALRQVNGCFACGRLGVAYWTHYGADPERIYISPYEPDYQLIAGLTEGIRSTVVKKYLLSPDRRRLLFCGRLVPAKRPDLLIDAFLAIAEVRPEWDLIVLGDGPLKEFLQAKSEGEYFSRIQWIPFSNDQTEVSAIYRACDVLVLPSDYEPWALVINEAVAAGMAVVATDVVAAAVELVEQGMNGRLVPVGELQPLKSALLEVTDENNIDEMKAASAEQLRNWREKGDPIDGIRKALKEAGVL